MKPESDMTCSRSGVGGWLTVAALHPLFLDAACPRRRLRLRYLQQTRRASVARHAISRRVFFRRGPLAVSAKLEKAIQANLRGLGYA